VVLQGSEYMVRSVGDVVSRYRVMAQCRLSWDELSLLSYSRVTFVR
jgi:hypothetical protein